MVFFDAVLYNAYLVPNNLTEDEEFLANDLVPTLLKALRKYINIPFLVAIILFRNVLIKIPITC